MNSSANKCPELLAPAGSLESLKAAVNAGADAVYIGGKRFGARAFAENSDEGDLLEGIRYAHLYGVHVHLTVNTLMKDRELAELPAYIAPYYEAGLDAAIIQDVGAFSVLHRHFPDLSLHASTQSTVTGVNSGLFFKHLGAVRLIPARELSLEELKELKRETGIEIETFVHGALCYSYSGQCLMSSLIGGRSGNRGRCAQTCRLPYTLMGQEKGKCIQKETTLLSCKDLCSLDIIPALIEAGIDSFKIEGRMKSPIYTAGVVEIWRRYLDLYAARGAEEFRVEEKDRQQLLNLFDRGGQTSGYFFEHNGKDMLTLGRKPNFREGDPALNARLEREYLRTNRKINVSGEAFFFENRPIKLCLSCEDVKTETYGACPTRAKTRGAEEKELRAHLMKTGGTAFQFGELRISLDKNIFLPVGQLKALRREAFRELERKISEKFERKVLNSPGESAGMGAFVSTSQNTENRVPILHVSCESAEQIEVCLRSPQVSEISFDADAVAPKRWKQSVLRIRKTKKKAYLCMPQIFKREASQFFISNQRALREANFDGFVIRSLEEVGFLQSIYAGCRETMPPFCFDFQVYGMNREATSVLRACGAFRLTLPVELNQAELKELGCEESELIVAGRLPMMVTAQCLKKTTTGCDKIPEIRMLRDRMGMNMPVKNHCTFCLNRILNATPLSLVGMREEVRKLAPASVRILLTTEGKEESERVVNHCSSAFLLGEKAEEPYDSFTRGHMKRGVL